MTHRLEKNIKILNELITFCYKHGATNIDMNLDFRKEYTTLKIKTSTKKISNEILEKLNQQLSMPRYHEVEENYWQLGGESEINGESEISLIGMMVDEAKVYIKNEELVVEIKRIE